MNPEDTQIQLPKRKLSLAALNSLDYQNYNNYIDKYAPSFDSAMSGTHSGAGGALPSQQLSGNLPSDVQTAANQTGETSFSGLCEAFVESVTGNKWQAPTAIDAFNSLASEGKAVSGLDGIKPGDPIYFNADSSNENDGHAGIYAGNGVFISATNNGVAAVKLDDWIKSTGQQPAGYVPQGGQNGN